MHHAIRRVGTLQVFLALVYWIILEQVCVGHGVARNQDSCCNTLQYKVRICVVNAANRHNKNGTKVRTMSGQEEEKKSTKIQLQMNNALAVSGFRGNYELRLCVLARIDRRFTRSLNCK